MSDDPFSIIGGKVEFIEIVMANIQLHGHEPTMHLNAADGRRLQALAQQMGYDKVFYQGSSEEGESNE